MPSNAEYPWFGSASAHHDHGGVYSSGGLARSPAFSFGGKWGFHSPRALVRASATAEGHSRDHSADFSSYYTNFGGLRGGGWHCRYRSCSRHGRNTDHLGSMAHNSSGYSSASPGCSFLTSGRAYSSTGGAMTWSLFIFLVLDTFLCSVYAFNFIFIFNLFS